MAQRKSIKKSVKFEVLKRDSFTCQYCGKSAPTVVLEIDHILPVCKGGDNEILNLVTSCYDCNRGKSGKPLTDMSTINAQKQQLKIINEKRNQFEMLKKWRESLLNLDDEEFNYFNAIWTNKTGYTINEHGKPRILKEIKTYGLNEVITSMELSVNQYFDNNNPANSIDNVYQKIFKILTYRKLDKENPTPSKIFYMMGILKNRFSLNDADKKMCFRLLKKAYELGESLDDLEFTAKECYSYRSFVSIMRNDYGAF